MEEVTVVIMNYNMEETIGDAVMSIVKQTFINWKLYVMDGGSTDNSVEVVRKIKDCRIEIIIDDTHMPQRITKGFRLSKSPYCMFLASDDRVEPTYLEENLKVFKDNPDVDIVYNSYTINTFDKNMVLCSTRENKLYTPDVDLMTCMYVGVFWLFKRELFEKVNGWDNTKESCFDYDFALKAQYVKAKFYYLDKLLGWYRMWTKNDSSVLSPKTLWLWGENTRELHKKWREKWKK